MTQRKSKRVVVTITATAGEESAGKVEFVLFNPTLADLKMLWEVEKILNSRSPSVIRIDFKE